MSKSVIAAKSIVLSFKMVNEVQDFLSSWKQFSLHDKNQLLSTLKLGDLNEAVKLKSACKLSDKVVAAGKDQIYQGVTLSCYYCYHYYYPTMHWSLDRLPETDNYWVGLFRKDASDSDYLTYQWVGKEAQGSYSIGEVKHTYSNLEMGFYLDEYELRIFRGNTRLNFAKTNKIRESVVVAPTDPLESANKEAFKFKQIKTDGTKDSFLQAIETTDEAKVTGSQMSKEDFDKKWNSFTPIQKQLLYPLLKHSSFPDEKRNPAPKLSTDLPEPKVLFSDPCKVATCKVEPLEDDAPTEIVLNLTLGDSYTYVYPKVEVMEAVDTKYAFMCLFRPQSTLNFDPSKYIDNDWQYVGEGHTGTTQLNFIEEHDSEEIVNPEYLGVIFDYDGESYVQLGYADTTIETVISQTDELPPADFKEDFDKEEALKFANLSCLAYEDYTEVQQQLPTYGLKAAMEINKGSYIANTVGFIASNDMSVVVAFRGTASFRNILTDILLKKGPISSDSDVEAASGFIHALDLVYTDVVDFLKTHLGGKKLYLTGHSLGGALASILGYRLVHVETGVCNSPPIQYVYGVPPVGDRHFADSINANFTSTITFLDDPVSSGILIKFLSYRGLFKPNEVKYLSEDGGHRILAYIDHLKKLLS